MKSFASLLVFCFVFAQSWGQDESLMEHLSRVKTQKFTDYELAFTTYFAKKGIDFATADPSILKGTGYKQVLRALDYHRRHLDDNGNIVNAEANNMRAFRDFMEINKGLETQSGTSPQTANWLYGGPYNIRDKSNIATGIGRVTFVKLDPNDASNASSATMYVGAPKGGLWRTTFNKTNFSVGTWTCLTDGLPNIGAVDLAIHPSNRNVLYMVSGDNNAGIGNVPSGIGIIKSLDGGRTWQPTKYYSDTPPFDRGNIRKLLMDTGNPLRMWIITTQGIYRTLDGWETFTLEQSGNFWDIKKGRNQSNQNLIACTNGLVYTSNDFGDTWTVVRNNANTGNYTFNSRRAELSVSANMANNRSFHLWYVTGTSSSTNNNFVSYDGGNSTWTTRTGTDATQHVYIDYCMATTASPTNSNFLIAGGLALQYSTNGGNTWTDYNDGIPNGGAFAGDIHADQHYIAYDQGFLFLGNDGGVYVRNTQFGKNGWQYLSDGMHITQYYRISYVNNSNGFRAMGGAQDMGTHSGSRHILGADGMESLINYNNPSTIIASTQNGYVYRSSNGGDDWNNFFPANFPNNDVWTTPMDMHKTNPAIVAMGRWSSPTASVQVHNGTSWSSKASLSNFGQFSWMAFSRSSPNVLYAVTRSRILKIDNVTAETPTTNNYALPASNISSVAVHPTNQATVYVCADGYSNGNKVWVSINSGANWSNITHNLPNVPVNCVLVNHMSGRNEIYAGTDIGVFVRLPEWNYWLPFMNGLPNTPVRDLEIDNNIVTCGTYGRGRWYTPQYGGCNNALILTPDNDPSNSNSTGFQLYSSSGTITSTRTITGGIGSDVTYRAGTHTTLLPGFRIDRGNELRVTIGPCFTSANPFSTENGSSTGEPNPEGSIRPPALSVNSYQQSTFKWQ